MFDLPDSNKDKKYKQAGAENLFNPLPDTAWSH